jgi:hypothetical protein
VAREHGQQQLAALPDLQAVTMKTVSTQNNRFQTGCTSKAKRQVSAKNAIGNQGLRRQFGVADQQVARQSKIVTGG